MVVQEGVLVLGPGRESAEMLGLYHEIFVWLELLFYLQEVILDLPRSDMSCLVWLP